MSRVLAFGFIGFMQIASEISIKVESTKSSLGTTTTTHLYLVAVLQQLLLGAHGLINAIRLILELGQLRVAGGQVKVELVPGGGQFLLDRTLPLQSDGQIVPAVVQVPLLVVHFLYAVRVRDSFQRGYGLVELGEVGRFILGTRSDNVRLVKLSR